MKRNVIKMRWNEVLERFVISVTILMLIIFSQESLCSQFGMSMCGDHFLSSPFHFYAVCLQWVEQYVMEREKNGGVPCTTTNDYPYSLAFDYGY